MAPRQSTDFLLLDLPLVRDDLARDFEGTTFETDDREVRVVHRHRHSGQRVRHLRGMRGRDGRAFWITIDRSLPGPD